jgi:hypothetical protein
MRYAISIFITIMILLPGFNCKGPEQGAATGIISVSVNTDNGVQLPCRAWVTVNHTRYFRPLTADAVPYPKDSSFSCYGQFEIEIPAGEAIIHVERGKEYFPLDEPVTVSANKTKNFNLVLKRWIDMAERGWYSMDIHCHFAADSLEILRQLSLADDISFQPVLTVWNAKKYKTFERWLAHSTKTWPTDAALCTRARNQSPGCLIDCDKPIWAENVVTMAFGLFNSVQICHNHFHRFSDMAACCGMAEFEVREDVPFPQARLLWQCNRAYYAFLNCGFRLAASGGSAMGVMPLPLGYDRTYVKLNGALTEKNMLEAVREGRTFATSGPMLFLTADGQDCGSTISFKTAQKKTVKIRTDLKTIQPVELLEIIYNGQVLKTLDLHGKMPQPLLEESIDFEFTPDRSSWIAARVLFLNEQGFLRQAHTSPVYIIKDGKPIVSAADARRLLAWLDKLIELNKTAGRYRSIAEQMAVGKEYQAAREIYVDILYRAESLN